MPRARAERAAALLRVLSEPGQRWGNLRAGLEPGGYEAMLDELRERGAIDFAEFRERELENDSGLSEAGLRAAYDRLPVGERLPWNHDPLDRNLVPEPVYLDWGPYLQQEMLEWVPELIQDAFGKVKFTMTGDFLALDQSDEAAIVAAFAKEGYACVRDQALVERACDN